MILKLSKEKSSGLDNDNQNYQISILKITALWAFSESAFGGILHALTIPLRGIFISSAAVLYISLVALFSKSSKEILKSILIVLIIKALVSPHSPLTAYFAVSVQGLLGYLLFITKKFYRSSALFLGILTLLFSGLQKIVVLTVLFGNTIWKSINIFIKQVSNEFLSLGLNPDIHYAYLLIGLYVSIHLIAGIFIGIYAGMLPGRINYHSKQIPQAFIEDSENNIPHRDRKKKKKSWIFRPSGIIILSASILLLIFSYISPASQEITALEIIIMIVRSILLTLLWYAIFAPIVKKLFQKYLSNKKSAYAKEIDEIINLFPAFKKVVSYCWKNSISEKGVKRIRKFLSTSFYYLLLS